MTRERYGADRQVLSTANNEYAQGINDETEWAENTEDYNVPLDEQISDYFEDPEDTDRPLYNESGFDRERLR